MGAVLLWPVRVGGAWLEARIPFPGRTSLRDGLATAACRDSGRKAATPLPPPPPRPSQSARPSAFPTAIASPIAISSPPSPPCAPAALAAATAAAALAALAALASAAAPASRKHQGICSAPPRAFSRSPSRASH